MGRAAVVLLMASTSWAQALGPVKVPVTSFNRGVQAGDQRDARIDGYDGGFWAVWTGHIRNTGYIDLYGARLNGDGAVLDRPIPIGTFAYDDWNPCLRCADDLCLVAWSRDDAFVVTRLSPSGARLDTSPVVVAPNVPRTSNECTVSLEDGGFHVAWSSGNEVYRTTVGRDGTTGRVEHASRAVEIDFASVRLGAADFVANTVSGDLFLSRFDGDGGLTSVLVNRRAREPAIATVGGQLLVVWSDSLRSLQLGFQWFDPSLASTSSELKVGTSFQEEPELSDAVRAGELALLSRDGPQTSFTLLRPDGGLTGPTVAASADLHQVRLDSRATLAVFRQDNSSTDVRFAPFVDGGVRMSGAFDLAVSGQALLQPQLARTSTGAVAAFVTEGGRTMSIDLLILDEAGNARGAPVQVATSPRGLNNPRVVSTGQRLQTVWVDTTTNSLMTRAAAADGTALGPASRLGAAANGAGLGLAGTTALTCARTPGGAMEAVLLDDRGSQSSRFSLATGAFQCAVAGAVDRFLVAWTNEAGGGRYTLVELDGGSASPRSLPNTDFNANVPNEIAAAAGPAGFIVVWRPEASSRLLGVRVDSQGQLVDTTAQVLFDRVDTGAEPQTEHRFSSVTFDGEAYLLAWDNSFVDGGAEVLARRISLDGGLGPIFALAEGPLDQEQVTLTTLSPGRVLAMWDEFEPLPGADSQRLRVRLIGSVRAGERCLADFECAVGACVASCCGCTSDGGLVGSVGPDAGSGGDGGTEGADGGVARRRSLGVGCGCTETGLTPCLLLGLFAVSWWRRSRASVR